VNYTVIDFLKELWWFTKIHNAFHQH